MSLVGVKETKEAMIGMVKLAALLASNFKDGVQAADFAVIIAKFESDPVLKQALMDAYNNIDQVPAEIKDIDLSEAFELGMTLLQVGPELIAAIRK